jgi:2-methylisocitrate lyase-like PEP mutase family enzyme
VRDAASFTESSPFVDVALNDFHINPAAPTLCESGGIRVTTPIAVTVDYDNDYSNFYEITVENVKEILSLNSKGEKISKLEDYSIKKEKKQDTENVISQDDVTRFDKK